MQMNIRLHWQEEFLEVYTVDQLMAETVEEYVTEISVRICGGDMDEL